MKDSDEAKAPITQTVASLQKIMERDGELMHQMDKEIKQLKDKNQRLTDRLAKKQPKRKVVREPHVPKLAMPTTHEQLVYLIRHEALHAIYKKEFEDRKRKREPEGSEIDKVINEALRGINNGTH